MVTWGVVAILMATVHTPRAFYVLRFLLGLAEAGFFPGIIVYLTHWFPTSERAKALGLFTAAIPVSNMLGAPISGLILGVHWAGLAGWRWLFVIEGAPAVVLGVVTFFFLTDRPSDARWLPGRREGLADRAARRRSARAGGPGAAPFRPRAARPSGVAARPRLLPHRRADLWLSAVDSPDGRQGIAPLSLRNRSDRRPRRTCSGCRRCCWSAGPPIARASGAGTRSCPCCCSRPASS